MSNSLSIRRWRYSFIAFVLVAAAVHSPLPAASAEMALPRFDGIVHGLGAADMYPVDVAVANGRYYVLDPGRYRVVAVDQVSGAIVGQVGGTRSAAPGALSAARGIDEGADGWIYVADSANNRVQVFSPDLEFIRSWGGRGTAPGGCGDRRRGN